MGLCASLAESPKLVRAFGIWTCGDFGIRLYEVATFDSPFTRRLSSCLFFRNVSLPMDISFDRASASRQRVYRVFGVLSLAWQSQTTPGNRRKSEPARLTGVAGAVQRECLGQIEAMRAVLSTSFLDPKHWRLGPPTQPNLFIAHGDLFPSLVRPWLQKK